MLVQGPKKSFITAMLYRHCNPTDNNVGAVGAVCFNRPAKYMVGGLLAIKQRFLRKGQQGHSVI